MFLRATLVAASVVVTLPAAAGEMKADEARRFVVGKLFSYTCFEGTRGAGRISADGSVAGTIQVGGAGPVRFASLPAGTIHVKGESVCASVKGLFLQPCFNLDQTSGRSFRGSISGLGFASCTFVRRHHPRVNVARNPGDPLPIQSATAMASGE